jgi:Transposase IS116/IS110/IS902 family
MSGVGRIRMPGIGAIAELTFHATVDAPARFKKSANVGAQFGLTLRRNQFGEADCCRKQGTASLEPNTLEACLTAGYLRRFRLTANIYEICVPICIVQRFKAPAFVTACALERKYEKLAYSRVPSGASTGCRSWSLPTKSQVSLSRKSLNQLTSSSMS